MVRVGEELVYGWTVLALWIGTASRGRTKQQSVATAEDLRHVVMTARATERVEAVSFRRDWVYRKAVSCRGCGLPWVVLDASVLWVPCMCASAQRGSNGHQAHYCESCRIRTFDEDHEEGMELSGAG